MTVESAPFIAVAVAAFVGAALATGIMWYMMVFDGFDYTRESWYAIPVLWGYVLVGLLLATHQRFAGGAVLLFGAYLVSTYFADVYGYIPGAVIAVAGFVLIGQDVLRRTASAGIHSRSDHA